jgi:hypothetical protein
VGLDGPARDSQREIGQADREVPVFGQQPLAAALDHVEARRPGLHQPVLHDRDTPAHLGVAAGQVPGKLVTHLRRHARWCPGRRDQADDDRVALLVHGRDGGAT